MKNLIIFCLVVFTSSMVFGQKKARFSDVLVVSGSFDNAHKFYYDATITYGADCYQIHAYVPAALTVMVTAFEYKGKKYSGNDIPGFQFPFQATDGGLKITAKIRYKINSSVDLFCASHLSINYSNQEAIAHMKDRLSLTKGGLAYVESDVERCSDWVKNAGDLFAIRVLSGSIGTKSGNRLLNLQLIKAIEKKEKSARFNANISDGNSAIDRGHVIDSKTYLVEAKKNNPNTQSSKQQIVDLTARITKVEKARDSSTVTSEVGTSATSAETYSKKDDAAALEKINTGETKKRRIIRLKNKNTLNDNVYKIKNLQQLQN